MLLKETQVHWFTQLDSFISSLFFTILRQMDKILELVWAFVRSYLLPYFPFCFVAQYAFAIIYCCTVIVTLSIYRIGGKIPVWAWGLIALSKRIHSIFVLRMFNDGVALLFGYIAILLFLNHKVGIFCIHTTFLNLSFYFIPATFNAVEAGVYTLLIIRYFAYVLSSSSWAQYLRSFSYFLSHSSIHKDEYVALCPWAAAMPPYGTRNRRNCALLAHMRCCASSRWVPISDVLSSGVSDPIFWVQQSIQVSVDSKL